jgi:Tfp pilus assembly protein FimT
MSLFELIVTLSICSLFYFVSFNNTAKMYNKIAAKQSVSLVFQALHYARHSAHTLDQSIYLSQKPDGISMHSNSEQDRAMSIPFKSYVSIDNSKQSVGFTSNQSTSRAGTLSIDDGIQFHYLTVGIGHGQIKIK